jgi:hypothetical protein
MLCEDYYYLYAQSWASRRRHDMGGWDGQRNTFVAGFARIQPVSKDPAEFLRIQLRRGLPPPQGEAGM